MPEYLYSPQGKLITQVLKEPTFAQDLKHNQIFYVLQDVEFPNITKFGVSQDLGLGGNPNVARFKKYNTQVQGRPIKVYFIFKTKINPLVVHRKIKTTEKKMKDWYSHKGLTAPNLGTERVLQTPEQVIDTFYRYFGMVQNPSQRHIQYMKEASKAGQAISTHISSPPPQLVRRSKRLASKPALQASTAQASSAQASSASAEKWEVERFVNERLHKYKGRWYTQYLVKWKGYADKDNTWVYEIPLKQDLKEHFETFRQDMIQRKEEEEAQKKRQKKR